jgi:Zn-dependent M32 family carboxypeptidase
MAAAMNMNVMLFVC